MALLHRRVPRAVLKTRVAGLLFVSAALSGCTSDGSAAADSGAAAAAAAADSGAAAASDDAGLDAGREAGAVGERLYATMMGADEVTVIDLESRAIVGHIAIGQNPAILLATPDHRKLYSANWGDNTLSAIDVATQSVVSIPLDSRPWVEAMSPNGRYVYVGLGSNKLAIVDTKTDTVTRSMEFDTLPASVIVSPDGRTLYIARLSSNTLEALSADTGEVLREPIGVGSSPAWITISPDGAFVYTLNFVSGDVTVVDTQSWQVVATVGGDPKSAGIVGNVTPDGAYLCVTEYGATDLACIDTKANAVAWTLATDGRPVGIGFSPDGRRGYVGAYGPTSLSTTPADLIAALASGTLLEVTGEGSITVFDPATGATIGEPIPVGPGPSSLVIVPAEGDENSR